MARVVRADVDHARAKWLESSKTEKDRHQREQTDFLSTKDHEGRVIDFHALRHSCGAWLAMRGENPKTIQSIMRHSTITLTMDTYGHLFPAAESDAIKRLESLFM
jgi:integrase